MRLFYLTVLDEFDREKCGILGKVKGQINSFNKAGFNVYFGHFQGKNKFIIEKEKIEKEIETGFGTTRARLKKINDELYNYIIKNNISIVYIRFTSLDKNIINFYKKLKKSNVKIIIEFYSHNLELEAQRTVVRNFKNGKYKKAIIGTISLIVNKIYFLKLKECVDLIVTTTKVDKLYGVQTINVINGIDTEKVCIRVHKKNEYDFNIISVAMISPWHGYDRIINGIYEYYKNGGTKNILYTVIGDGEEKSKLEKMVQSLNLQNHVKFTGVKINEELNQYYNQADIALEMLAGFRRTNGRISSIKMAEYFAKGIPILYSADEKLYSEDVDKFCLRVDNNDNPINIGDVISFCENLYSQNHNVEICMHKIAHDKFDWTSTMKELIEYIKR